MIPTVSYELEQAPRRDGKLNAMLRAHLPDLALNRSKQRVCVRLVAEVDREVTSKSLDVDQNVPELQEMLMDELGGAPAIEKIWIDS
jgi:hypothetical protein